MSCYYQSKEGLLVAVWHVASFVFSKISDLTPILVFLCYSCLVIVYVLLHFPLDLSIHPWNIPSSRYCLLIASDLYMVDMFLDRVHQAIFKYSPWHRCSTVYQLFLSHLHRVSSYPPWSYRYFLSYIVMFNIYFFLI